MRGILSVCSEYFNELLVVVCGARFELLTGQTVRAGVCLCVSVCVCLVCVCTSCPGGGGTASFKV